MIGNTWTINCEHPILVHSLTYIHDMHGLYTFESRVFVYMITTFFHDHFHPKQLPPRF